MLSINPSKCRRFVISLLIRLNRNPTKGCYNYNLVNTSPLRPIETTDSTLETTQMH